MKYLLVYNLILFLSVYIVVDDYKRSNHNYNRLIDVKGLPIDKGIEKLEKYNIVINYIKSDLDKDVIIKTYPMGNSLICDNDIITIYVSTGTNNIEFKNLVNSLYSLNIEYLNSLEENYNVNIKIKYIKDNTNLDGLIIKQETEDSIIDENDYLYLEIVSNRNTIVFPNLIGKSIYDAIQYGIENDLIFEFEYIKSTLPYNFICAANISSGSIVLKGSTITLYVSREE